jgi:hypothetical protein
MVQTNHNIAISVKVHFQWVSPFAHPETRRDLAAKAANYLEKTARGGWF